MLLKSLPDPAFSRSFLMNGAIAWILVRVALYVVSGLLASTFGPPALVLELPASVGVVALCSALIVMDVIRRHERILLANLGTSLGVVAVIGAIPALVAETFAAALATIVGG